MNNNNSKFLKSKVETYMSNLILYWKPICPTNSSPISIGYIKITNPGFGPATFWKNEGFFADLKMWDTKCEIN